MKNISTVHVDLGSRSYDIRIGQGWISELGAILKTQSPRHRFVLITNADIQTKWGDSVLKRLRSEGLTCDLMSIPEGEEFKNLESLSTIFDFLIERKYDRQTVLIALGGGVIGDVVGFASAAFLRGVPLVQLPTSLLAMVDSSVGGKTGVNHPLGKNLLGAFKQPVFVGIELDFLKTLPEKEYVAGLAEVVKYGMIHDAPFFEYLEARVPQLLKRDPETLARIITRSCEIKAHVVMEDEEDKGLRAILNFGHTFGHAVENLTHYGTVRHGEAVAMGMMAACRLANLMGVFGEPETDRLERLLADLGLPTLMPRFTTDEYLDVMRSDKKVKSGRMNFIVPLRIGEVAVRDDVEELTTLRALEASMTANEYPTPKAYKLEAN